MEKKLQFTDREEISIEETGAGLVILLNTGIYEMIKLNIEGYYNNVSLQYKYTHIPVNDKRGNLVETNTKCRRVTRAYIHSICITPSVHIS